MTNVIPFFLPATEAKKGSEPAPPPPPPFAELGVTTNFSFLRGASHPEEMIIQAAALGMRGTFDAYSGSTQLLFAFEAAVIGGAGSVWGTLIGGIVLALAQTLGAKVSPLGFLIAGHTVFLVVLFVRVWIAGGIRPFLRRRA